MNIYTVYVHICPNNKKYIGITCKKPEYRWDNGKGYKNNDHFYKAIQKYGWDNIQHKILFTGLTKEEAEQKEIELIAKYNTTDREYGYNNEKGGHYAGKMSKRSKDKLSKSVKELWQNVEYRKKQEAKTPPMLGKHHSQEARQKISEKAKKRKITNEQKEKLRISMIGKHHKEETKEKIRQKMLGRKMSDEAKKKISEQRKGKSTWVKGQKLTKQHREKISKSLIKYYNSKK